MGKLIEPLLSRRSVLLGIGGASISAAACAATQSGDKKQVGYAIVGLGYYATRIIMPEFAKCSRSRLTALVSGTPEKLQRFGDEYKLPKRSLYSYADFDSIRDNPDVDVVYVILPNAMHAEYTIRAAKAGKHVLCEKPMAVSSAECEAMIAACKAANRKLMIGYRSHFEPHNMLAMKLTRDGAFGKPSLVESDHGFSIGDPTQWRLKRALSGGGSLMDIGIYSVQALRYMSGEEPVSITAIEQTDRSDPRFKEVEDRLDFAFGFPSGATGKGLSTYSSGHNRIKLTGDKGWVEMAPATGYSGHQMWTSERGKSRAVEPPRAPWPNQFVGQLDHMADCVLTGREPLVAGEEGLRDLRIMEGIYRSAREGRTVTL